MTLETDAVDLGSSLADHVDDAFGAFDLVGDSHTMACALVGCGALVWSLAGIVTSGCDGGAGWWGRRPVLVDVVVIVIC